ncbi:MAG: DUF4012 domain-containing protein, partial [Actinobacteria bacterium]|nr:DUF4012 domain-containing protein [Actinomycetota bacterium]
MGGVRVRPARVAHLAAPPPEPGATVRRTAGGRRRRLLRAGILAAALGLVSVATVVAARSSGAAWGELDGARRAMETGRLALVEGRVADARWAFREARAGLGRARDHLDSPVLRGIRALPVAGRSLDAVHAMIEAGTSLARSGETMATALDELPGGLGALAPTGGGVPLEPLRRLLGPLERSHGLLVEAREVLRGAPRTLVLGPVAGELADLSERLDRAVETVATARDLVREVPVLLGGEGTRRYFVGAQNPAELRGTGGLIGAYSILAARDGRIAIEPFRPIHGLPNLPVGRVPAPNGDYSRRYDRFGGAGFWQNINMTPDFPSAAAAIEGLYERVAGRRLDGTILVDPFAVAALLELVGPAAIPGTDRVQEAEDAVAFHSNEAFGVIPEGAERKEVLGEATAVVLRELLDGGADDPLAVAGAIVELVDGGHLLLHSTDPEVQAALGQAGATGALPGGDGDFLGVVVNNAGGNKLDFYADRRVSYEVELRPGGRSVGRATVELANGAPESGQPRYVIGPFPGASGAGESVMHVSTFCAASCLLERFSRDGEVGPSGSEVELSHRVYSTVLRLPGGAETRLSYAWSVEVAWSGEGVRGVYRLAVLGQSSIRP